MYSTIQYIAVIGIFVALLICFIVSTAIFYMNIYSKATEQAHKSIDEATGKE